MDDLQLFNFKGSQVRTAVINNKPYFVGKDVANILGYSNTRDALSKHVDEEDKGVAKLDTLGGMQRLSIINESGLYSLIMDSKLPTSRAFKHWVTSEVLPSIQKHGAYMTDKKAFSVLHNSDGLADLLQQAADQLKEKDVQISEMRPKALFADAVATSNHSILIGDLAKLIKQNGIDIGANRLFQWMRDQGYLIRRKGSDYNSPTQKSMNLRLFEIKETTISHADGHITVNKTPKVTGKGQQYFVNRFLSRKGEQSCNVISLN